MRVCIISLGCPKNLVDSEVIAGHLDGASPGIELELDPAQADAVVINTCGFVEPARKESFDTIEEVLRLKEKGRLFAVVVVGCLVQLLGKKLKAMAMLEGVDAFLPISDYSGVPAVLKALEKNTSRSIPMKSGGAPRTSHTDMGRLLLTLPHVSYLRIAEGCNHSCSFCAIPAIRGRLRSKPMDALVDEAEALASLGVRELVLVAEDTTDFGRDIAGKPLLPDLLRRLSRVKGIGWIRILYAYPSRVTRELINEIAENPKVLNYIDMPVQHIDLRILKSMRRGTSPEKIVRIIETLRKEIPDIVIRTSVIVGYPGETERAFGKLFDFVKHTQFDRLGAFLFSEEERTPASRLPGRIPRHVAEKRLEKIMKLEKSIIVNRNKSLVGSELEVIVDGPAGGGKIAARTHGDAPEIDCVITIESNKSLKSGAVLKARVTGYDGYDLVGVPAGTGKQRRPRPHGERKKTAETLSRAGIRASVLVKDHQ